MPRLNLQNTNSTFGSSGTFGHSASLPSLLASFIAPRDDFDELEDCPQEAAATTQATDEVTIAMSSADLEAAFNATNGASATVAGSATARPMTPPPPRSLFMATKPLAPTGGAALAGHRPATRQYLSRPPRMQSLVARSLLSPTFSRRNRRNDHTSIF